MRSTMASKSPWAPPPVMPKPPVRSDDRSRRVRSGCSSTAMAIASTAFHTVMRSRSMRCRASNRVEGLHEHEGRAVAQRRERDASPPHVPDNGNACRTRSSGVRRSTSPQYQPWGTRCGG